MITLMKNIITIFLSICLSSTAFSQEWIDYGDTSQIREILNGSWVLHIYGEKYNIELNFDDNSLETIDSTNIHWFLEATCKYTIEWEDYDRIFLKAETVEPRERNTVDRFEIWVVDGETILMKIGGDFGIHYMDKKRKKRKKK